MYPGFVFGFTDNITRSKTINGLLCRRSSYQPNISDCTHAACEAIVKPLSAFCLCARSDAKPGKALSCRCNTSMLDLNGQTSLQKPQINTESNIH